MIDISNADAKYIKKEWESESSDGCVRINLYKRGCNGPIFRMEKGHIKTDRDEVLRKEGLTIVADKKYTDEFGGIKIEVIPSPWGGANVQIRPWMDMAVYGCGDCRC